MWKTVRLGEICDILDKLRKPITKKDRVSGNIPYYGATGVVDWVAEYIFDERLVLVGEDGAKWGSGDKTAFLIEGKSWVNNHAHVLRPHSDKVLHEWLAYCLTATDLSPWITGLTVPKLNQAQLRTIPIPLPPLAEQQRIVAKLDAAFAEIDKALLVAEAKGVEVENLRNRIIDGKFSEIHNEQPLGEHCVFIRGPFGGSLKKNIFVDDGYAVYEQRHAIRKNCESFRYFITKDKFEEMKRFSVVAGAILMSCSGTIGKTTIVPDIHRDGIINQALLMIKPSQSVLSKYLNYYMESSRFSLQLMDTVGGSAITNVASVKVLKSIKMPIPGVDRQALVVNEIEAAFSEIEIAKAAIAKSKANYQTLKSAILAQELQPSEAA